MDPSRANLSEQSPDHAILEAAWGAIRQRMDDWPGDRLLVTGLCGAQGSGKSTLAAALARRAGEQGIAAAVLSIDDLYLTRDEREDLARKVHPLLLTRGPPGTHDIALGLETIDALERGEPVRLPRFDKGRDDRAPEIEWDSASADTRLLILEGWCVGAVPQEEAALVAPVNTLERDEDPHGAWRAACNNALADGYRKLFARIDLLILLAAPDFDIVREWRGQQEESLHQANAPEAMDDAAIARFIQHYERLTRHILIEMPSRADLVVRLAPDRTAIGIETR